MKLTHGLFMALTIFIGLAACVHNVENEQISQNDYDRLTVYTSFHAMYDFTRAIAGDSLNVAILLPPGSGAHHWEPSVQDIVRLAGAEAFIYHGAGMEHFVDTLKASLGRELLFIEASADVEAKKSQSDPHLWLNPMYVLQMKETIKYALIEIDPLNSIVFEENFNNSARRLQELDDAFRAASANFSRRDIVVSHGAFGHLSYAYNLNQVAIEGIMVHTDPSPARIVEIINFVKDNGVTTIFFDKDPSLAEAIAANTGTKIAMLDTFEGITTDDYFSVMWRNLDVLKEALR
ncbi:MAG: zinc ABC transporter substrate-binding protein [Defluviitaleaceae bacterium]|nr:zinc ABC transporter substrate-binding protein [Defluviitaleaceae bacterium]